MTFAMRQRDSLCSLPRRRFGRRLSFLSVAWCNVFDRGGRAYLVLLGIIAAPIVAGLLRKIVPGQPAMLRIAGVLPAVIAFVFLWGRSPRLPRALLLPLYLWGAMQLVYAIPALLYDPALGIAALLTSLAPMTLVKSSYVIVVRQPASMERVSNVLGMLALVLLPIAVVAVTFGNSVLPSWLRAIELAQEARVEAYKGLFESPSTIFPTPTDMAHSMLVCTYLFAAVLHGRTVARRTSWWPWLCAGTAVFLVFLCSRRLILLAALTGVVLPLARSPRSRVVGGVMILGVVAAIFALDSSGLISGDAESRTAVYENLPVGEYFREFAIGVTARWAELNPFGSFLGYAGPVGEAFGVEWAYPVVEVGAALLVAEMGILGVVLMSGMVVVVAWTLLSRSAGLRCRYAVWQLVLYFVVAYIIFLVKSSRFLTLGSMAHLAFWACPGIACALIRNERNLRAEIK